MTNGGGCTEKQKADELNYKLGFKADDESRIREEHVILCTTIFNDAAFSKYKESFVLVESFSRDDGELAASYGFKKYITVVELCALYPEISPASIFDCL